MMWTILPPAAEEARTLPPHDPPRCDRPFAVAVVVHRDPGRSCSRADGVAGMRGVDPDRIAVAVEAARCGYALGDVREVADDDPVTGAEWAGAWNTAVHLDAQVMIVSGTPDLAAVETVAARLGLTLHLSPRTGPGPARLRSRSGPIRLVNTVGTGEDGPGDGRGGDAPAPLAPPAWARRSIVEGGGITHETVSPCHPVIVAGDLGGWRLVPSEVSLSVQDLPVGDDWARTRATVVIDGGIYDPDATGQLLSILTEFLTAIAIDERPPSRQ
ncbi:MAG: hypothetical protein QG622_3329 [Actinomycetota bacterium]|nr:hypothetical protein [Actinomycetota bacterium]